MKKIFKPIAALTAVLTLACAFAFAACSDGGKAPPAPEAGVSGGYSICYAFTATGDQMTITQNTSMKDYLDSLAEDGKITFTGSDGSYGFHIDSVFGINEVATEFTANTWAGYSWMVYTSLITLDGVIYADESIKAEYNGVEFYLASYGVSGLPVVEGYSYALIYEYSYSSW